MTDSFGIKASKHRENVLTTANKNLVYSSGFNSLKIYSSGNTTATGDPTDISHSLGYESAFLAYSYDVSDDSGYLLSMGLGAAWITATMDNAKLRFDNTANGDKVAYFILYDPADTSFTDYAGSKTESLGVKISQDGENVADVTDTDLSFNSEFNTLQIRDIYTMNGPTSGGKITINHNYGYPPAFLAQIQRTSGGTVYYNPMPFWDQFAGVAIYCESQTNKIDVHSVGYNFSKDAIRIVTFTEALE